jgi:ribonuclease P/MRP protein subunit RPP40
MLHGKKGFDRIVYAFKNVLTNPVTWLFHDLSAEGTLVLKLKPTYCIYTLTIDKAITLDPLNIYFPTKKTVSPEVSQPIKAQIPTLKPPTDVDPSYGADFEDYAVDIHEWLSLALLESPRIDPNDKIDSFLSRYVPPGDYFTNCNLIKITWQGFISPSWAHKAFVQMLLAAPQDEWFAYCVVGFGDGPLGECKNCTTLKLPDAPKEYVLWEIA